MSGPDVNAAVDLSHFVDVEWLGRRAVDDRSSSDIEARAVALAHDRRPREQTSGERACLTAAGAEIVERVETIVDTRDRDPQLAIGQVVGNDKVVGNRIARPDRSEGVQ